MYMYLISPGLLMVWPNFLHIGVLSIFVRPMICLLATVFYLIMKALDGAKLLLPEKSPDP